MWTFIQFSSASWALMTAEFISHSIVAAIGVKPWRVTQPTYIQLFDWQNGCGGSS